MNRYLEKIAAVLNVGRMSTGIFRMRSRVPMRRMYNQLLQAQKGSGNPAVSREAGSLLKKRVQSRFVKF